MCRFCEKLAYGDEEHKMIEPLAETKNIVLAIDDIASPIYQRTNDATMTVYNSATSETDQIGINYCPKCGRPLRKIQTHPITREAFKGNDWIVDVYPGREVYIHKNKKGVFARVIAYANGRTDLVVHDGDKTTVEGFRAQIRVETLEDIKAVLGVYGLTTRFDYENL